jgi:hypothetical protein
MTRPYEPLSYPPPLMTISRDPANAAAGAVPASTFAAHPATAVGWISLSELARVLGRSNPRAARDWCNRHEVPYFRDGKHNFARLTDVQHALEALPERSDSVEKANLRPAASRAATAIMAGRGR